MSEKIKSYTEDRERAEIRVEKHRLTDAELKERRGRVWEEYDQ